jgi:hypothetical protein
MSSDPRAPVLGRNDSLGTMLSVGNGIDGDLERGYEGSNGTLRRVLPTRRPSTQLTGWRKVCSSCRYLEFSAYLVLA